MQRLQNQKNRNGYRVKMASEWKSEAKDVEISNLWVEPTREKRNDGT